MSYNLLAAKSATLAAKSATAKTEEDKAWEGSPFDWFRKKASSTKGKIGRDLAASLLEACGFAVSRVGVGLEANGKTIRVKLSLMWGAGVFTFEQIRETDFDFLLCLGLYPDSSYGWLIPKSELLIDGALQDREGLSGQHGGQDDPNDFWISAVNTENVYPWLEPYGGTTDVLMKVIKDSL
jgi:hypothetical protein